MSGTKPGFECAISWRKMLASFFGTAGLSFSIGLAVITNEEAAQVDTAISIIQSILVVLGLFLATISVFVWKGSGWSRLSLLGALGIGIGAMVVLAVFDFIETTDSVVSGIGNICFYTSLLMFPALLLGVLAHPDVAREFKKE